MQSLKLLTCFWATVAVGALGVSPVLAEEEKQPIDIVTTWNYDELYTEGISVQRLLDAEVYDASAEDVVNGEDDGVEEQEVGEDIGEVENLVVSPKDGSVTGIIIETGGFLDIGDTHLLYPFDQARIENTDAVYIKIKEDSIEEYSLLPTVEDQPIWGSKWRITDLLNDYAALEGEVPYGMVTDVIIDKKGDILSVIVTPDIAYGYGGLYAWPYYGTRYGFDPRLPYFPVPYSEEEVAGLAAFDYGALSMDNSVAMDNSVE